MKLLLQDFIHHQAQAHLGSHIIPIDQRHRPHTHDFHEVFWITQGKALHEWENGSVEMLPGDCQTIPAEVVHRVIAAGSQPVRLKVLAFHPSLLKDALVPESYWFNSSTDLEPVHFSPAYVKLLESQCELFKTHAANHLAAMTLLHVLKSMINSPVQHQPNIPIWLKVLRTEMLKPEYLREGLPVLLNKSGKSQAYLCRQWKHAFGESPTHFINRERISWAQQLLIHTDQPVNKIAMEVGFHDNSYFFRQFQQINHCTPLAYRSRQRRSFQAGI